MCAVSRKMISAIWLEMTAATATSTNRRKRFPVSPSSLRRMGAGRWRREAALSRESADAMDVLGVGVWPGLTRQLETTGTAERWTAASAMLRLQQATLPGGGSQPLRTAHADR